MNDIDAQAPGMRRTLAEIEELNAETRKLLAEAAKEPPESAWRPFLLMAGAFAAGAGVVKLVIGCLTATP